MHHRARKRTTQEPLSVTTHHILHLLDHKRFSADLLTVYKCGRSLNDVSMWRLKNPTHPSVSVWGSISARSTPDKSWCKTFPQHVSVSVDKESMPSCSHHTQRFVFTSIQQFASQKTSSQTHDLSCFVQMCWTAGGHCGAAHRGHRRGHTFLLSATVREWF